MFPFLLCMCPPYRWIQPKLEWPLVICKFTIISLYMWLFNINCEFFTDRVGFCRELSDNWYLGTELVSYYLYRRNILQAKLSISLSKYKKCYCVCPSAGLNHIYVPDNSGSSFLTGSRVKLYDSFYSRSLCSGHVVFTSLMALQGNLWTSCKWEKFPSSSI